MKEQFSITLTCLFCDAPLQGEEKEFQSGDLIKCSNCNEVNDYDSLRDIAIDKGTELAKNEAMKEITKMFKKFGK